MFVCWLSLSHTRPINKEGRLKSIVVKNNYSFHFHRSIIGCKTSIISILSFVCFIIWKSIFGHKFYFWPTHATAYTHTSTQTPSSSNIFRPFCPLSICTAGRLSARNSLSLVHSTKIRPFLFFVQHRHTLWCLDTIKEYFDQSRPTFFRKLIQHFSQQNPRTQLISFRKFSIRREKKFFDQPSSYFEKRIKSVPQFDGSIKSASKWLKKG